MYITTEEDLIALCERLKPSSVLALDTEFVRERTYYHRLGLIQVASESVCAVIDPIRIRNIDPFLDLIKNQNTLKVFHAARQDLEIMHRLCGDVLRPVFDTQIAASVVGWGAQISFAKIVHKVLGKKIHKAETYTDWCRRPLSDSQIEYALDDVRLLFPVYQKLVAVLKKYKREDWLEGEFKFLEDPENFKAPEPQRLFARIKNVRSLFPQNLAVMYELSAWREGEAQNRDCLAKSIVRDEPLLEIARKLPKDEQGLGQIRGFHRKEVARSSKEIFAAIQKGLQTPEDQIPQLPEVDVYHAPPGVEELLAAHVRVRAEELKIEATVLADRKKIHDFVKCYEQNKNMEDHALYRGWRKEGIGTLLYSVLKGEQGLAIGKEGRLKVLPLH
ncbi:MAG: ribonuclease D [Nitrospinae bacterium]|nr:ribonuclease D [Nitrospinota bacterium]